MSTSLRPCPKCGHHISKSARTCPNCGHTFTSFSGVIVLLVLTLGALYLMRFI